MDNSSEASTAQKIDLFMTEAKESPWSAGSLGKLLLGLPEIKFCHASTVGTIAKACSESSACIVLIAITEEDDTQLVYPFILSLSQRIKNKSVCIVILLKKSNVKLEKLFLRAGCSEVLEYSIAAKTLSHKIKRQAAILFKSLIPEVDSPQFIKMKGAPKTQENEVYFKGTAISQIEPLPARVIQTEYPGSEKTYWLFRQKKYARKYHDYWLIEIIGPGPNAGKWIRLTSEPLDNEKWKWEARFPNSEFDPSPAMWVFTGSKPCFDRTVNRWSFVSPNPRLELISNGKVTELLFYKKSDLILQVNDSSARALERLPSILETFDPERQWIDGDVALLLPGRDLLDTKNLTPKNWHIVQAQASSSPKSGLSALDAELQEVMMGEAAMERCGLSATLDDIPIVLVSYVPGAKSIVLGIGKESPVKQTIEVHVLIENMGENSKMNKELTLVGTQVSGKTGEQENEVTIELNETSKLAFLEIEKAVAKRQREIFYFFSRARGA